MLACALMSMPNEYARKCIFVHMSVKKYEYEMALDAYHAQVYASGHAHSIVAPCPKVQVEEAVLSGAVAANRVASWAAEAEE